MSIDEMTGVQALERKHPGLPMAPGKVERREFEYIKMSMLGTIKPWLSGCCTAIQRQKLPTPKHENWDTAEP